MYYNVSKIAAVCLMSYHINSPQPILCLPTRHLTNIPCRVHVLENKKRKAFYIFVNYFSYFDILQ